MSFFFCLYLRFDDTDFCYVFASRTISGLETRDFASTDKSVLVCLFGSVREAKIDKRQKKILRSCFRPAVICINLWCSSLLFSLHVYDMAFFCSFRRLDSDSVSLPGRFRSSCLHLLQRCVWISSARAIMMITILPVFLLFSFDSFPRL